jgi:hypothetical protein
MRYHPRIKPLWQRTLVLCIGLAVGACGRASAPTRPSLPGPPPGPAVSVLGIREVTIYGSAKSWAPSISLVETGGRSDAFVTSVTFNLADGIPWPKPVECGAYCSARVKAGGDGSILPVVNEDGEYVWSLSVPEDYTGRLWVMVSYQDEEGRKGSVNELVMLPWAH